MATPKGKPGKTPKKPRKISRVEWTCDVCDEDKEYPDDKIYKIGDYHEDICGRCYDRGLLWSIKEGFKWRGQVKIDAKKGKK